MKVEQDFTGQYPQAGGANIDVLRGTWTTQGELARVQNNWRNTRALARCFWGWGITQGRPPGKSSGPNPAAMEQIDARLAGRRRTGLPSPRHTTHPHLPERDPGRITTPCASARLNSAGWSTSAFVRSWLTTWAWRKATCPFAAELVEVRKTEQVARRHQRARWAAPPPAHSGAARSNAHRPAVGEPAAQQAAVRLLEVRDAACGLADGLHAAQPQTRSAHGPPEHAAPTAARPGPPLRADVETLERPHAMTAQGLMSSQSGHFDKQDQKRLDRLDDGFDNRDRLVHLLQQWAAGA